MRLWAPRCQCGVERRMSKTHAFHRMKMPAWLQRYFALPSLTAEELGISMADGTPVAPGGEIFPLPRALPLGFAWSLY